MNDDTKLYVLLLFVCIVFVNSQSSKHIAVSSRPMAGAERSDDVVPNLAVLGPHALVSSHVQTST